MRTKSNLPRRASAQEMAVSKSKAAKDFLKKPYARVLVPEEDGRFSAEILEFPGCYSQGDTAQEAFENLEKAAEGWIEACVEQNQDIPLPSVNHGYSGHVALRLPRDLHRQAARKAARDGVSLNQSLVTAIAAWVGADNLFERLATKIHVNLLQANFIDFQSNFAAEDLNLEEIERTGTEVGVTYA